MVTDGETDDHVVYIMSSDYINAYDNFIKNVKTPENDTDAANKKYVDDISATISSTLETTVNTVSMDISAAFEAADEALDTKLSNKITVDGICVDTLPIEHINNEDFYKLVADDKVQASVMYIVSGDYVNAYDMNIKNVHDPVAD